MCQRVMIAAALICRPRLLIADEPTTALDVTIQAQILDLMKRLRDEVGTSIIIITHDMGVVAEMADDVAVMYGGRVVERGPVDTIFSAPAHPYTHLLLATVPRLDGHRKSALRTIEGIVPGVDQWPKGCRFRSRCPACDRRLRAPPASRSRRRSWARRCLLAHRSSEGTRMTEPDLPLLSVRNLKVHFPVRGSEGGVVKAVDGISFDIPSGRTVALVGESGCGKSTTAYAIIGLEPVSSGSIRFEGREIAHLDRQARRDLATEIQIVFQDPSAALNPKMTIGDSIGEPLVIQGWRRDKRMQRVRELLDLVGLPAAYAERTPNALSGGQRQRVVIARALALSPKLLVLDEPVSALDVSIRSQILNLLMELQKELGLSYLFISHDLSVVRHLADDVIVMYLGTVVEEGGAEALFEAPRHPYTQALISAIPLPDPRAQRSRERIILKGDLPSPLNPPTGCPFVGRCPIRIEPCSSIRPSLQPVPSGTRAACLVRAPAPLAA